MSNIFIWIELEFQSMVKLQEMWLHDGNFTNADWLTDITESWDAIASKNDCNSWIISGYSIVVKMTAIISDLSIVVKWLLLFQIIVVW